MGPILTRGSCLIIVMLVMLLRLLITAASAHAQTITSLSSGSWKIAPQADVAATGEEVSTTGFASNDWLTATVPGTVFNAYVVAGKEKDPNYGDNIYNVDLSKYDRNFWYRTDFAIPEEYRGKTIRLNLDGVNRDADVFVNGSKVGSMHGFFLRGRYDVTALVKIGGPNSLAVLDYVPPFSKKENFSSPAFICSRGWDWMPRVPGLEMGIYKDVYLSGTGDLTLKDPWIRTVNANADAADLTLQTEVQNDGSSEVSGELVGEIEPGHVRFAQPVTIKARQTQTVSLNADTTTALHISHPALWWPNGYGDPNLYTMRLFIRAANVVSDQKTITFGIRKFTYDTDNQTLHFHINGVRLFLKGGSWGMAEYLLRCNAKDYETMLRFHREGNFNIIRNWMGMTPDEAFYDACDKNGMMVWDEFWLNSLGGPPRDTEVFEENAIDKIKQFRNHACVCLWCGDNEGTPPKPLNAFLADAVNTYDGGDRR